MKELFMDVKQIGIRGALSNMVVRKLYGAKAKISIARGNANSMRLHMEHGLDEMVEVNEGCFMEELKEDVSDSSSN